MLDIKPFKKLAGIKSGYSWRGIRSTYRLARRTRKRPQKRQLSGLRFYAIRKNKSEVPAVKLVRF